MTRKQEIDTRITQFKNEKQVDRRKFVAAGGALTAAATLPFHAGSVTAAQDAEPQSGGSLVIAVGDSPESLDNYIASAPSAGTIYDNIFEELVFMEPDGSIVPGLAASWENVEPDRWRVVLREGVTWHNGEAFDTSDIQYHFDRIFNPDAPGRPVGLTPGFKAIEVVDELTFDIITDGPYPMMINDLAPRWNVISSNEVAIEEFGDAYGDNPVGTGPFTFVEWEVGSHVKVAANDDYWGGRPYLDEVTFRVIPEEASRLLALEAGEVDMVYGIPRHEVSRLDESSDYDVLRATTFVTQYFVFNTTNEFFQDAQVRNAIAHGLNKDLLVEVALEGQGESATQIVSPGVLGYTEGEDTSWAYDPELAGQMLDDAGWTLNGDGIREKDGQTFSVEFSFAINPRRYPEGTSELIQNDLSQIGLDVQLRQWESAAILSEYATGNLAIMQYAQGLGTGHFGQLGYNHFHSQGGRNYHFLHESNPDASAQLDEVLDAASSEFDEATRLDLWNQVKAINHEQALMIPLYHPYDLAAVRPGVEDAYMHPGEYLRMKGVWLSDEG